MAAEAIVTHELTKVYHPGIGRKPIRSLDNLSLAIHVGEVFGFLGQNGAGKTTTIKMLCSLLKPTSGSATILGEDIRKREARLQIGYMPENPYFYEYLTPRETLDFYGKLNGLSQVVRAAEWERLADLLALRDISEQRIRTFSKGMRQRLAFAVALVGDPAVLILDEPMSGLDPVGRRGFRELILRLGHEGKTVFFSSHVLSDVEQLCDRIALLAKGKLRRMGRIDELCGQNPRGVEVIAAGVPEGARDRLDALASAARESEAGRHFMAPDLATANALVQALHECGATITEFTPLRESLEDFFMREQEETAS